MPTETKYYCKDCGKELSENERPCSKCGGSARDIKVDIYDYFPAGSAELNSVKQRVQGLIQSGTYKDNTLMLTKKEFEAAMAKNDRKAKLYFLYGLIVGIVGIIITIITSYFW